MAAGSSLGHKHCASVGCKFLVIFRLPRGVKDMGRKCCITMKCSRQSSRNVVLSDFVLDRRSLDRKVLRVDAAGAAALLMGQRESGAAKAHGGRRPRPVLNTHAAPWCCQRSTHVNANMERGSS